MYKFFLYLLKIGTLFNLYFLLTTFFEPLKSIDIYLLLPAQIFFFVSAFRCLFPTRYTNYSVLHDSFFSSIFITRIFATFAEVTYIYLFSYNLRLLNYNQVHLVDILSWIMVLQVIVSQVFVWSAILTEKHKYYFYEEAGWFIIFIINTFSSIFLLFNIEIIDDKILLIQLNIAFGIFYLPWQLIHLKSIQSRFKNNDDLNEIDVMKISLMQGLKKSIQKKYITTESDDWGGLIGMMWMVGYWATIIPFWIYIIIKYYI